MTRMTDANLFFVGSEPKFTTEITEMQLSRALSWYSQNKDKKDAYKYACDYFKKKLKVDATSVLKDASTTFGFMCRLVSNGAILIEKNQTWFDKEIESIKEQLKKPVAVAVDDTPSIKANTPNIQDRIRDKAYECIGELEGLLDDYITSKYKHDVSPYGTMTTMTIKDAQVKYILEWAKKYRAQYDEVLTTADKDLKEGYSNFTKPELKKVISYFDQVILDCQKVSGDSAKTRKPRKVKSKTPEQMVAKMNFMKEFTELKLVSVKPTEVIGAMTLWVYNTKNRKLGVYLAEDAGGLSVKGSSLVNFSESKSVQKTLRKPADVLPEILKGGKVYLRNALNNIRAVESGLTGRINSDIILLKTTK
jgi:hypothetical protein